MQEKGKDEVRQKPQDEIPGERRIPACKMANIAPSGGDQEASKDQR